MICAHVVEQAVIISMGSTLSREIWGHAPLGNFGFLAFFECLVHSDGEASYYHGVLYSMLTSLVTIVTQLEM